jgi:PIN domain nuclease of toxin-antitoxin system
MEPKKLSKHHSELIASKENRVYLSSISLTEIAIKSSIGKLDIPFDPYQKALESNIALESYKPETYFILRRMPFHHKDPFDRMLIAQAKTEGFLLMTVDERIKEYDVNYI